MMRADEPFGGLNDTNYIQAFDPNGDRWMLNGPFEARHDRVFAPQEINKNYLKTGMIAAGVLFLIYILLKGE